MAEYPEVTVGAEVDDFARSDTAERSRVEIARIEIDATITARPATTRAVERNAVRDDWAIDNQGAAAGRSGKVSNITSVDIPGRDQPSINLSHTGVDIDIVGEDDGLRDTGQGGKILVIAVGEDEAGWIRATISSSAANIGTDI